uniref:Proteasome alpha-type subunits domain-containing protein n=2 Tax=Phaeomonas parva TaxID=124430 RepID=A0A7S1U880_9STRA|mmetsp:Transcript_33547/g.105991  ORF Transcript_33547/g.105991 Transcript_33547/m.105991 type:complete len:242 (+) Transcript_33547:232-957(+)
MGDNYFNFSLTTFNRSGRLLQIEYALNAVRNGKLSIGICAKDGVVIVTEKKMPSVLFDAKDVTKIEPITTSCGMVFAGLMADFRVLVRRSRKRSQTYKLTYGENQPISQLVKETAQVVQEYTQSGGVRPFGVSVLAAGYDEEGPHLYQIDPSGVYIAWKATAIGKGDQNAKSDLERRATAGISFDDMTLDDAIHHALQTLRTGMEGEMTKTNIQVGVVDGTTKAFRILSEEEVQDFLEEAR